MSCDPSDDRAACCGTSSVELLLAIAGEFGAGEAAATQRLLDDLALPLFGLAASDAQTQAQQLLRVMRHEHGFAAAGGDHPGHLLLPRVVVTRRGHPLMLAIVACELAQRAGITAGVFSSPRRWFVGLQADDHLLLLDASLADADQAPLEVRPHCRHELACCALTGLSRSYARSGQPELARHAAWLKLTLPIADASRAQVRREIDALDATERRRP
jgi:hypothetical protein